MNWFLRGMSDRPLASSTGWAIGPKRFAKPTMAGFDSFAKEGDLDAVQVKAWRPRRVVEGAGSQRR